MILNERPDWLRDPSDLTVTPEDIASAERYYQVTMRRGGVLPSAIPTQITPIPVKQLHNKVIRLVLNQTSEETIANVVVHFREEIAYTLFCSRHKQEHPSKDPVSRRLKELWWIVEYLE